MSRQHDALVRAWRANTTMPTRAELEEAVERGVLIRAEGARVRRWELITRLNVMVRRGEIAEQMVELVHGERISIYAMRLKPLRNVWPRRTYIALTIAAAASGLAWMIWDARYVIGAVLLGLVALAAMVAMLMRLAGGAGSGCSCVIHGSWCKG